MVGLPRNKIDRFENPARGRRRLVLGGGAKVRLVAKFIAGRAAPRPTKKVAPSGCRLSHVIASLHLAFVGVREFRCEVADRDVPRRAWRTARASRQGASPAINDLFPGDIAQDESTAATIAKRFSALAHSVNVRKPTISPLVEVERKFPMSVGVSRAR